MEYTIQDRIVYARHEGKNLRLTLFRPATSTPNLHPAVLLIHGGGWVWGTRYQVHWFGRRLAAEGYVCAAIDYRKLPRFRFPACIEDCHAALGWFARNAADLKIDTSRIAVLGQSAGAHMAVWLGLRGKPDFPPQESPAVSGVIVRGVVNFYGPVDLSIYGAGAGAGLAHRVVDTWVRGFTSGIPDELGDPLGFASPVSHFHDEMSPVLFLHGARDRLVPCAVARTAHERLRHLGVATEFVEFADRRHAFDHLSRTARRAAFNGVREFLERHLA